MSADAVPDPPDKVRDDYRRKAAAPGLGPVLDPGDAGDVKNAYLDYVHRRLLRRHLPLLGARTADLGCGIGRLTEPLARQGRVVGLDFSPEMLVLARGRLGAGAALACADLARLPLLSGSLSGVLMCFVALHLDDETFARALAEVSRVLQPGGALLLFAHVAPGTETRVYEGATNRPAGRVVEMLRDAGLATDACLGAKKTPSRVVDWVKRGRLPRALWWLGAALDRRLCTWRLQHTDYIECLFAARKPGGDRPELPSSGEMLSSLFLPRRWLASDARRRPGS